MGVVWMGFRRAWDVEIGFDDREGYGMCPACGRTLRVIGGFKCDGCKRRVCEECIRKYGRKYMCLSCTTELPEAERRKVEPADDLINTLPSAFRRTYLWWLFMVLVVLPAMLGSAWFF